MNCQAVQNQILALPDPRQLSPALRDHVIECPECREWARQAARLEALIAQLPVPPASAQKKEALIDELTCGPVITRVPTVPAVHSGEWLSATGRFLRRNATYVGSLAAAVLVALGVYWLWPDNTVTVVAEPTQSHPLLKKMVARDISLARANTPKERLEVLGGMADDLAGETRGMARIASPAELKQMAGWYDKVVKEGMVQQAEKMPEHAMTLAEKQKVFEAMASKLEADAVEAERMMGETPQDSQPALKRMADSARDGQKTLRELARKGL